MTITCFIRYEIDPFQRDAFKAYAQHWSRIIPRCGGHLVGYFLPHEGTNNVGWGLVAFDSLAAYERPQADDIRRPPPEGDEETSGGRAFPHEAYRSRLKADPEAQQNFAMAQSKRLILREERTFVETVDGSFNLEPQLDPQPDRV